MKDAPFLIGQWCLYHPFLTFFLALAFFATISDFAGKK